MYSKGHKNNIFYLQSSALGGQYVILSKMLSFLTVIMTARLASFLPMKRGTVKRMKIMRGIRKFKKIKGRMKQKNLNSLLAALFWKMN